LTDEGSRADSASPEILQFEADTPTMSPSSYGDESDPAQVPPAAQNGLLARPRLLTLVTTVAGAAVIASAITYSALQDGSGTEALDEGTSSDDMPMPNFPPVPTESSSSLRDAIPAASPKPPARAASSPNGAGPADGTDSPDGTGSAGGAGPAPSTPRPPSDSATPKTPRKPPAGKTRSLQSVNYPDRYVRNRNGLGMLDQVNGADSAQARRDATFTVVAGLANKQCSSFISQDGRYLRHFSFRIRLDTADGSSLFKKDATFCERPGLNGSVLLESYNYPGRFIRHYDFALRLDRYEYTQVFRADASFWMADPLHS
jgi:Alpha-L-arabinofuranosidase B (ABFB) domain